MGILIRLYTTDKVKHRLNIFVLNSFLLEVASVFTRPRELSSSVYTLPNIPVSQCNSDCSRIFVIMLGRATLPTTGHQVVTLLFSLLNRFLSTLSPDR